MATYRVLEVIVVTPLHGGVCPGGFGICACIVGWGVIGSPIPSFSDAPPRPRNITLGPAPNPTPDGGAMGLAGCLPALQLVIPAGWLVAIRCWSSRISYSWVGGLVRIGGSYGRPLAVVLGASMGGGAKWPMLFYNSGISQHWPAVVDSYVFGSLEFGWPSDR